MSVISHEIKKLYQKNKYQYSSLKAFARDLDNEISQQWFKNKHSNTRIKPIKLEKKDEGKKNLPTTRKR